DGTPFISQSAVAAFLLFAIFLTSWLKHRIYNLNACQSVFCVFRKPLFTKGAAKVRRMAIFFKSLNQTRR
ncbi:MAG: hypothetical protein KDC65_10860, partial [Saprospiraceae bacterium]|nr:hypothetical protein [Saprospiraceae bacterium]